MKRILCKHNQKYSVIEKRKYLLNSSLEYIFFIRLYQAYKHILYIITLTMSNNPTFILRTVHYHFQGHQDKNLNLVSQQYRTWSDCTDVQSGLALYWWQRLITFGVGRIRVKVSSFLFNYHMIPNVKAIKTDLKVSQKIIRRLEMNMAQCLTVQSKKKFLFFRNKYFLQITDRL